jgi:hypothetical protein
MVCVLTLLWPEQSHTSPNLTSVSVALSVQLAPAAQATVIEYPAPAAVGGSSAFHLPAGLPSTAGTTCLAPLASVSVTSMHLPLPQVILPMEPYTAAFSGADDSTIWLERVRLKLRPPFFVIYGGLGGAIGCYHKQSIKG